MQNEEVHLNLVIDCQRSSANSVMEGMVLQLADGTICACNASVQSILGYTPEQIQGFTSTSLPWQTIHQDGSPFLSETHPAMVSLQTGEPCLNVVMGFYKPEGELVWLKLNSQPLFRANEAAPYAVVTTFTDISELQELQNQGDYQETGSLEEVLKASIESLTSTLESITDAFYALDKQWRFTYVNEYAAQLLHKNSLELIGKNIWQEFPEAVGTIFDHEYHRAMFSNVRVDFEEFYPPLNAYYGVRTYPSENGLAVHFQDITQRKQAQEGLRFSEERYRSLIEATSQIIWDTLAEGELVSEQPGWSAFTGQTYDEYKGWGWLNAIHPDDRSHTAQAWSKAIANGAFYEVEHRLRRYDGEYRYMSVRGVPIFDSDGKVREWIGAHTDITERPQTEEALRHSETKLKCFVDSNIVGVLFANLGGNITGANHAFLAMMGYTEEDLRLGNMRWRSMTPPEYFPIDEQAIAKIRETGSCPPFEKEYIRKDGTRVPILIGVTMLPESQEDCFCFVLDLSDRKQAEEALRRSEEFNRRMLDSSKDCIKVLDLSGRILYMNSGGQRLLEIDDFSSFVNADWLSFWEEAVRQKAESAMNIAKAGGVGKFQGFCPTAKGTPKWWEVVVTPMLDAVGQVEQMVSISRDITERKQAEVEREQMLLKLQQYTNQLQGLTDAALAVNAAISIEEILQLINQEARSIISAHQSVTTLTNDQDWSNSIFAISLSDKYAPWRDYTEMPDVSGIYAWVCQMNHSVRMTQAELELNPHWQGFGFEASKHPPMRGWLAAPLVGRDGRNIGLIQLSDKYEGEFTVEDESIIVQLAQMASIAIENTLLYDASSLACSQAEAANRVKDEFLAVLSHELRTPLNSILGWANLLKSGKLDAVKTSLAVTTIERNAKMQASLIEDLLDISRILRGKLILNPSTVNLESIIISALETTRLAAEAKAIEIHTWFEPHIGQVFGDATRLQQVVWNLLSNAIKFTPNGGQVEVRLSTSPELGTQLFPIPGSVFIQVRDTGKGIKPEFLPYIFDYFRQEDSTITRHFGGLGLGLSIVRQLVELHGGTVVAESLGEKQGATFTISLPLMGNGSKQIEIPESTETLLDLSGIKVLVVDDEIDSRDLVVFVLEEYGANVTAVGSAAEVLQVLSELQPDILVSDIGMPETDGYALVRKIRSLELESVRRTPAIALTAYAGDFDQQQALKSGFQAHIAKPFEPAQLAAIVAQFAQPSA